MLRFEDVAEILRIIDSSSCEELILDLTDVKLVVRRHAAASPTPQIAPSPFPSAPAASADAGAPTRAAPPAPATATRLKPPAMGHVEIKAPMVGTFYVAPSPGAPPFCPVGGSVSKGDKLCMIEVMKLFTTIFAEQSGRIVEVCAEDGELVEYGRTLFLLEPP